MRGDRIPEGYEAGSLQQFDPRQMELYKQQFQNVGQDSYLGKLAAGDQSFFQEMEAPAMRQFQGKLGNLASRFSAGSGQGSLGNRRSSGFQNTATSAMSNFSQELQANRQKLQQQAIHDLMGLSNTLLGQRPRERILSQRPQEEESGWGGLFGAGAGALGGFALGGPTGAFKGAQIGYGVGSGF